MSETRCIAKGCNAPADGLDGEHCQEHWEEYSDRMWWAMVTCDPSILPDPALAQYMFEEVQDGDEQHGPARRLVERTIVALEHRGSAQSSDEVADWDAALRKICDEAAALDAKYAALETQLSATEWVAKTHAEQSEAKSRRIARLEAQLAEADEVMAGQVARARAAYEQRCAELEAQLADAQAALERLRAERWEPVADGVDCTENIHYTIRPDGDHIIVTPTWGGTPQRLYLGKARRLCQRVTGA